MPNDKPLATGHWPLATNRIGILISGRGSNMTALLDAIADGRLDAEVAVVISNIETAAGLAKARERGVEALFISHKGRPREAHDAEIIQELQRRDVRLVCLAGYMRLVSGAFVRAFENRILNIHPSLLPAFPGVDAQAQAFQYGVRISGCTVHFVDEHLDAGPILVQRAVEVLDTDDEPSLAARILEQEHEAYVEALVKLSTRRYEIVGRRVVFTSER
jgi:phosphoribosylglycinamide formyltransferase 1